MGERCISAEGVKLSGAFRKKAEPYADTTLESPARAPKVHDGCGRLISQAKGQRKSVTLPVIVKVDNAGFQSYFLLETPAFLFILLSWRETKKWI